MSTRFVPKGKELKPGERHLGIKRSDEASMFTRPQRLLPIDSPERKLFLAARRRAQRFASPEAREFMADLGLGFSENEGDWEVWKYTDQTGGYRLVRRSRIDKGD